MRLRNLHVGDQRLVDLVPVVNVVLLLLLFFLLSWSFIHQTGFVIRPPSVDFPAATPQGRHVVTLKANGADPLIFLDEKSMDWLALQVQLKILSQKSPGEWITINADDSVSHGHVQRVASWLFEYGFKATTATQRTVPGPAPALP